MLKVVSHVVLTKQTQYSALVNTSATKFARAIDLFVRTNIISDAEPVQQNFSLCGSNGNGHGKTLVPTSAFMDCILKEDSTDVFVDVTCSVHSRNT